MTSKKRENILIKKGDILRVKVTGFTDDMVFLRYQDTFKGFLPQSRISWADEDVLPAAAFSIEQKIDVVVTRVKNNQKGRIVFEADHRATLKNPWQEVASVHPVGSRTNATIVDFAPFGAFVRLESGFRALLHDNEVSWTRSILTPDGTRRTTPTVKGHFQIGDTIPVVVLGHDCAKRKLSVSYRATTRNPWTTVAKDYLPQTRLRGFVVNVKHYGLFVRLPNGCVGLLHESKIPIDYREGYSLGDEIRVIIEDIERDKERIGLALDVGDITSQWNSITSQDVYPDLEIGGRTPRHFEEGSRKVVSLNCYERNPSARRVCLAHYGMCCSICAIDLRDIYGAIADGVIHVHHLTPVAEIGELYVLDALRDLRPVCPNCHAVVHRRTPPFTIEEVRRFIQRIRNT